MTATRRSESVEKVPISINALSQKDLTEGAIKSINDLAEVTPGLQLPAPQGFISTLNTISIRGLNTLTGPSTVGLYLGETPIQTRLTFLGNVGNPYPLMFDLNRVEVARGPQGTLFGAGSEAGTVRFIPNEPSLDEFSGFSHAELASTQDGAPSYEIGAAAGGPIVKDEVGFRVSVWNRQDGGYINLVDPITGDIAKHNANKNDKWAVRGALTFLADDIRITSSFHYQSIQQYDSGRFYNEGSLFSDPSQGRFIDEPLAPEVSRDSFWLPSVKIEAPLPFAELTSVTSYMHRLVGATLDNSGNLGGLGTQIGLPADGYGSPLGPEIATLPSDIAPVLTGLKLQSITQEIRLASNQPDAFFAWVGGLFYDHRQQLDYQSSTSLTVVPTGGQVFAFTQRIVDDQIAAYAQADFHLTHKLTATLGDRIAHVKSDQTNVTPPSFFGAGVPPFAASSYRGTPSTPRLALSYQADSSNLFYVSASEGFRVGGGNQGLPDFCNYTAPNSYGPDHLWSYEVGAKNSLFNGRVTLDSSVFHVKWSQIQELVVLTCGVGFTENTGAAVSNGFDFALRALATERLLLALSVGYADAYYTGDVRDPFGNLLVQKGDAIGALPMVNAPWNVSSSATYKIPVSQDGTIRLRGEYQYNSRNPGPFASQIPTSPGYFPQLVPDPPTHLTNLRLGYTRDKMDVSLFVDNLFNTHPLLGQYGFVPTSSLFSYSTFRPRTVGLAVNFEF